jgi:hypothetical protein
MEALGYALFDLWRRRGNVNEKVLRAEMGYESLGALQAGRPRSHTDDEFGPLGKRLL